jgi:hypothetical protein
VITKGAQAWFVCRTPARVGKAGIEHLEGVGEFQNFVNQRIKENLFVFI